MTYDLQQIIDSRLPAGNPIVRVDGVMSNGLDLYLDDISFTDADTLDTRGNNTFNQYTSVGDAMQTHDANGNVTYDGKHTYVWDVFNRLAQVKEGTTVVATYSYDTQGRRMRKVVGSATRDFAYDGWRSVAEYPSAVTTTPDREYVFGAFLDEPIEMRSSGTAWYYHQNWQYSVVGLSHSNGGVYYAWEYDPYGGFVGFAGEGPVTFNTSNDDVYLNPPDLGGNPFTYTGQRLDPESGLMYYKHRYYDVGRGRFMSRDPLIILHPQLTAYDFLLCHPIRSTDKFGLMSDEEASNLPVMHNFEEGRHHLQFGDGSSMQYAGGFDAIYETTPVIPSDFPGFDDLLTNNSISGEIPLDLRLELTPNGQAGYDLGSITYHLSGKLTVNRSQCTYDVDGRIAIFDDRFDYNPRRWGERNYWTELGVRYERWVLGEAYHPFWVAIRGHKDVNYANVSLAEPKVPAIGSDDSLSPKSRTLTRDVSYSPGAPPPGPRYFSYYTYRGYGTME